MNYNYVIRHKKKMTLLNIRLSLVNVTNIFLKKINKLQFIEIKEDWYNKKIKKLTCIYRKDNKLKYNKRLKTFTKNKKKKMEENSKKQKNLQKTQKQMNL